MKNVGKIIFILLFVVVFACGLNLWIQTSPWVYDYQVIHSRETADGLVMAFATALRINHPAAYEMIDPSLKPRLDEWMNEHQVTKCVEIAEYFFVGSGTEVGYSVDFSCADENGEWLSFEMDNIAIAGMQVVAWGEVKESEGW